MRTYNIITSRGTWTIKGINLYSACKAANLELSQYPGIKILEAKEINKPFATDIQPQFISWESVKAQFFTI